MNTIIQRQTDIMNIIKAVDISPTMYRNAVEKYEHLASYLEEKGFDVTIYPQGSFALGTVVRPLHKGEDAVYDLDFIYMVHKHKQNIQPSELRNEVENALRSNSVYNDRLIVDDTCFTIRYADIGDVGFTIDIVPAADEDEWYKAQLREKSDLPHLIDTAIAIPRKEDRSYKWISNNPKGYKQWFDAINESFARYTREDYRNQLYHSNRTVFASIEEVPDDLTRTSLQRVIQILKYHRNMYYLRIKDGDKIKPISAILSTLAAEIAKSAPKTVDVFGLLEYVLNELMIYAKQLEVPKASFRDVYSTRNLLLKDGGNWTLHNPANPEDNLTDSWKDNPQAAAVFFRWIKAVYSDLITSLHKEDQEFRVSIAEAFGDKQVRKTWGSKYESVIAAPILSQGRAKPWKGM